MFVKHTFFLGDGYILYLPNQVFDLRVALRVSPGCPGVLSVPECPKFIRMIVDKFLPTISVYLLWCREPVYPMMEDACSNGGGFFVGMGTTSAIFEKASVMHSTCL